MDGDDSGKRNHAQEGFDSNQKRESLYNNPEWIGLGGPTEKDQSGALKKLLWKDLDYGEVAVEKHWSGNPRR